MNFSGHDLLMSEDFFYSYWVLYLVVDAKERKREKSAYIWHVSPPSYSLNTRLGLLSSWSLVF